MREPQGVNRISQLELTMRAVLDGMEELANGFAFSASDAEFEILAITPPADKSLRAVPRERRKPAPPCPVYALPERDVA